MNESKIESNKTQFFVGQELWLKVKVVDISEEDGGDTPVFVGIDSIIQALTQDGRVSKSGDIVLYTDSEVKTGVRVRELRTYCIPESTPPKPFSVGDLVIDSFGEGIIESIDESFQQVYIKYNKETMLRYGRRGSAYNLNGRIDYKSTNRVLFHKFENPIIMVDSYSEEELLKEEIKRLEMKLKKS